uniref:Rab-GAP TBC domain-containing protein n=1 Tax=Panagrellus redivivus TaxID=6233 RepID=A0A7E4VKE2_PANRE
MSLNTVEWRRLLISGIRSFTPTFFLNAQYFRVKTDESGAIGSLLPSRNFYQLAYVQRATSDILATSSVFFVEPTSESPMVAFSTKPIRRKSPIREQPLISSRNWSHQANPTAGTSNMITGASRPSWTSFFCGTSEATASFILPGEDERDDGCDFDEDDSSASCDVPPERQRLLDCSVDDGFEDEKDKGSLYPPTRTPSTASSIAQFLIDLWRQPFSAPTNSAERRSASMYEIGASSYGHQTPSMINTAEPYQKMVCQLTKSNNVLLHENERLTRRVQHLEMALQDNTVQLHSLYYTLNRNGIENVVLPNGEEVQLSQFRGHLLNFTKSSEMLRNGSTASGYASRQMRFERTIEQHSSESSSSGSLDQDELKAAMLKCITKLKYNDLDDFVNWLNDDRSPSRVHSARFEPNRKSRSLEEYMHDSLRIRVPLQRSPRVERCESEHFEAGSNGDIGGTVGQPTMAPIPETRQGSINKSKSQRIRAQSVTGSRINGFLGSRRTSSCVRQSSESRSSGQRKSLANLGSMRSTNRGAPRRNLI